ncbi:uncharacterized protein LOC143100018 isoform X1 [Alosa pseudoharengus]|uniref:uncharacterized protein LOC143100018 isoform X1 n=1 Tax=Alosa pseudoharengus TaxID=34774 RepID=UPI003F890E41
MNITGFFIFCAACTVLCRALEAPPPPYDVDLERNKALLKWRSSDSHNSTYTVQYQIGREDGVWHDLPGCVNTPEKQCDFSAMATHLYGATLQVRTQRHNVSSPWQQSKQEVGCVHTGSCSPEVVAMASPGYLSVQMDRERSDQSLQYEHAHLSYRVLYGREGGNMKVFCEGCVSAVRVEPLAVGERYCVQVRYLLYSKPYGSPSDPVCRLIPHSEREKELYLAVSLAAAFSVLVALSIGCYCFINRHYTHIKDYMRPPCSIPDHLIEVTHTHTHTHTHTIKDYMRPCSLPDHFTEVKHTHTHTHSRVKTGIGVLLNSSQKVKKRALKKHQKTLNSMENLESSKEPARKTQKMLCRPGLEWAF